MQATEVVAQGGLIDAKPVRGLGDASGRPNGIQRHQQIQIDFRKPGMVDINFMHRIYPRGEKSRS